MVVGGGGDAHDLLGLRQVGVGCGDANATSCSRAAGQELAIEVLRVHGLASRQAVLDVRSSAGVLPAMLSELGGN